MYATRPVIQSIINTGHQIGDALIKLKHPYGGFLDGLQMYSPGSGTSIYGPAITVKMVETKSPGPTPPIHFADANKPGHIMYIQQPKGLPSACWGGLMSTRAQKLGSLGTIIDGRMRDTQEHIDMKYPVCDRVSYPACIKRRLFELIVVTGLCAKHVRPWIEWIHPCIGDQCPFAIQGRSLDLPGGYPSG